MVNFSELGEMCKSYEVLLNVGFNPLVLHLAASSDHTSQLVLMRMLQHTVPCTSTVNKAHGYLNLLLC